MDTTYSILDSFSRKTPNAIVKWMVIKATIKQWNSGLIFASCNSSMGEIIPSVVIRLVVITWNS